MQAQDKIRRNQIIQNAEESMLQDVVEENRDIRYGSGKPGPASGAAELSRLKYFGGYSVNSV